MRLVRVLLNIFFEHILSWFYKPLTIEQVLAYNTNKFLSSLNVIDHTHTPNILNSFNKAVDTIEYTGNLRLVVCSNLGTVAKSDRSTIYVTISLENKSELERLFIIFHEIGHIVGCDYIKKVNTYKQYLHNTNVTQQQVDDVNCHPAVIRSSRLREHMADYYAWKHAADLGWSTSEIIETMMDIGNAPANYTHPSTVQRIEHIKKVAESKLK
jgi:Zn-dependent protease with chaperone function